MTKITVCYGLCLEIICPIFGYKNMKPHDYLARDSVCQERDALDEEYWFFPGSCLVVFFPARFALLLPSLPLLFLWCLEHEQPAL